MAGVVCARQLALLGVMIAAAGLTAPAATGAQGPLPALAATVHPPLPLDLAHYWLVPSEPAPADGPARRLAEGVGLLEAGRPAEALPLLRAGGLDASLLAPYARYYEGLALLAASRTAEAVTVFASVAARDVPGVVRHLATLRLAEAAMAAGDAGRAARVLDTWSREGTVDREEVLLQLARAEEAAGLSDRATETYGRLYFEFPASVQAATAAEALARLQPGGLTAGDVTRALARADRLFEARRWADARAAFGDVAPRVRGDDREYVAFRLAQSDHHLGRHQAARDALRPLLESSRFGVEARFLHLTSTRALGQHATYVTLVRRLVSDHPESDWAAEALNALASHYITTGDEAQADAVFRELYRRFPSHRHAERAAWRIGWRAYRQGRFAETAALFESAAAAFPRSDHRPQWLYWSGRARDRMGDRARAHERYRLTVTDYQNIYHGRLAAQILDTRREPAVAANVRMAAPAPGAGVPSATVIRALAAAGFHDAALREVDYARTVWGDSAQLQATTAWLLHQQGLTRSGTDRFTALRGAITTMRRAYPQFMAAGGEALPPDVLQIIFPLDYWPLIQKYAAPHGLDPYLMAALMAQESTFTPEIRSSANAIGLMQIIPATGERYAARLGIRNFSSTMLTQPEINVRIGMRYFKDLIDRFGGAHLALAGYNAGEGRVQRWMQERPGLAQDEFIEDIPFAETQNYVKRILGTAEDYRRLYGSGLLDPAGGGATVARAR